MTALKSLTLLSWAVFNRGTHCRRKKTAAEACKTNPHIGQIRSPYRLPYRSPYRLNRSDRCTDHTDQITAQTKSGHCTDHTDQITETTAQIISPYRAHRSPSRISITCTGTIYRKRNQSGHRTLHIGKSGTSPISIVPQRRRSPSLAIVLQGERGPISPLLFPPASAP